MESSGLTQIHTFPYSIRQGTVGASLPNQVEEKVKEQRAEIIKKISAEKLNNFITKNIGLVKEVLIEKHPDKQTGLLKGVTANYLTVLVNSKDYSLHNTLAKVKILHRENGKIYSELMCQ